MPDSEDQPSGDGIPALPELRRLGAGASLRALSAVMNQPTGIFSRHRPFFFLNLIERLRGPNTLADAVAGKVVVVTGASSGIGAEAARRIGAAGGRVMLIARSADELERIAEEIGRGRGEAEARPCDLSDHDQTERVLGEIVADHDGVDVLINNAGKSIRRSILRSLDRFHDYERLVELNYLGAVRATLAVLPGMRERGDGHVINVSSAGVPVRTPRFSAYVASKAALDAFAECASAELAHHGIRFTTIHMPLVRTPMIAPTKMYRSMPSISSEEAAERIEKALIHRPRFIGTPYSGLASVTATVSPAGIEAARNAGYRMTEDSEAARES